MFYAYGHHQTRPSFFNLKSANPLQQLMAFRKRNVAVATASASSDQSAPTSSGKVHSPGTRPSLSGAANVTSTGTAELDGLLGGHGGLLLGSSLLIGEHGTTDYAGVLLRAYVAEGLLQGHDVHLVGVGKEWSHNLPAVALESSKDSKTHDKREAGGTANKMKIAWRYESLGRAGEKVTPARQTQATASSPLPQQQVEVPFCHTFDLTRRLEPNQMHKLHFVSLGAVNDPFSSVIKTLQTALTSSPASSVHRIAIPLLLSPGFYPPTACQPDRILHFIHALRALLQKQSTKSTAMLSIPLSLFPHTSAIAHWLARLSDGFIELVPFPYVAGASAPDPSGKKDAAQGMLRVLKLPMSTERGEGGAGSGNTIGDDLAFTLSRRKFVIEPFSLPPMEGDQEAQSEAGKLTAKDVEF